ncbi:hypothetical protein LOTGIDRAFT_227329 [Lottia gigantea]|uniref:EF-hand domain-containing protein n=1 Tax=Lottia gigantea TaxID=225164 RepID=V4AJK0_LOTGI|nr:hypothetical protein LOTGIDRAFT_227329 [Lottia gigantea]ESO94875.1 hypothetical protein LOTGIDRAFT_227329 [Lottia gigantea]
MGNEASFLTTEQIQEISTQTPFKSKDVEKLLKRYAHYDSSEKGINGIPYNTCVSMPEFAGNKFAPHLMQHYMDKNSRKIYPKQFLLICGAFSPETSALKKKELLFEIFDSGKSGVMTHGEVFSLYKILFGNAVSDKIILDLTFRALNHPDLDKPGEIRKDEFLKMIPDNEIKTKFSVDLQII